MPLINAKDALEKSKQCKESAELERKNATLKFIEEVVVPKIESAIVGGITNCSIKSFEEFDFMFVKEELRKNGYRADFTSRRPSCSGASTYSLDNYRETTINISWS